MDYPCLLLKKGRDLSLRRGHPWLFSGAIASETAHLAPGDVVGLADHTGRPLAIGFYGRGDIAFRLLSHDPDARIDAHFWRRRLEDALALRRRIVPPETDAYRLINAEGDRMPGLVVDRYGDHLVMTIATAGMERWRDAIVAILGDLCSPVGIYDRSEGISRRIEGLADRSGPVAGPVSPTLVIRENGLRFEVDLAAGQKTGFYLDQRPNRRLVGELSRGLDVLNCFSYTGAFSVYAARGGARRVVSVEASEAANEAARRNFLLNGLAPEDHPVITANCFDYLRGSTEEFDLVILDPPAFAKTRRDVPRSCRGYKEINLQAAKRIRQGGILATFSCSNPLDEDLFAKVVLGAVRDAGKTAQVLAVLGPGPDHPVNLAHPEGRYLKGLLLSLRSV